MSLSKVRKLLEHYEDICIEENMKFFKIINNIEAQINVKEEEYIKVSKIFDQKDNCIHIHKDPTKSSLFQFINKHYLFMVPLDIEFGGMIQYQIDSNNHTLNNTKKNSIELSIQDVFIFSNSEGSSSTSKCNTYENYIIIGGNIHECKKINIDNIANQKDWLKLLKDYNNW
ncbi:hypothetical protein F8M41_014566 [Gigaspora margarita]|uniref:Uncharacterized protein n=1 Tax=Gigaspora margarita TaxID=4874 RepID=A0A8H4EW75_GIGMA|nr:hypothetical protein F8M41_014566 [Gigaspora margarita]